MRKLLLLLLVVPLLCTTAHAEEWTTSTEDTSMQTLEEGLTGDAAELMEGIEGDDFADGAAHIFSGAMAEGQSTLSQAISLAAVVLGVVLLCGMLGTLHDGSGLQPAAVAGALGITAACTIQFRAMIQLGAETVQQLSDYSALLLPALASATVASGAYTSASTMYAGTVLFTSILTALIGKLLIPLVYLFIGVATVNAALDNHMLESVRDFISWIISASLKTILYVYTGYITISGIISGVSDAVSVKAAKLAMGNMIPVVGGIISDASETVVVSASILKQSIGIFGMLAVLAFCLAPFFRIAVHYLVLKVTKAVCGTVGRKNHVDLVGDLSTAMGFLLGMTATCAVMLLISVVCSLKVVSF